MRGAKIEQSGSSHEGPESTLELDQIKHYGISMLGPIFDIWCIMPKMTATRGWAGCQIRQVGSGKCTIDRDVHLLIDWVNEIHFWGLTVHGPMCEEDVKLCMDANPPKAWPTSINFT